VSETFKTRGYDPQFDTFADLREWAGGMINSCFTPAAIVEVGKVIRRVTLAHSHLKDL
jgi:hypothetical protein